MNKIRSTEENVGVAYADRKENLLEWLYRLRDRQRQHQRQGAGGGGEATEDRGSARKEVSSLAR